MKNGERVDSDMSDRVNDRKPNFRDDDGNLFLVRCFACGPEIGRENWVASVASGECTWCGWKEEKAETPS